MSDNDIACPIWGHQPQYPKSIGASVGDGPLRAGQAGGSGRETQRSIIQASWVSKAPPPQAVMPSLLQGNQSVWPEVTHGAYLKPLVTVWDAIGDLPPLLNGERPEAPLPYGAAPATEYQAYLRGNATRVLNHEAPRLQSINLRR